MNAINFIKQHGVDKAREVVECSPKDAELFHTNTYIKNAHSEGRTDHFARWSDGFNGWVNASADREFIDESIVLEELKRIVESVDLIGEYGGLYGAIDFISGYTEEQLAKPIYSPMLRLKQAIADYEQLFGNSETLGGYSK